MVYSNTFIFACLMLAACAGSALAVANAHPDISKTEGILFIGKDRLLAVAVFFTSIISTGVRLLASHAFLHGTALVVIAFSSALIYRLSMQLRRHEARQAEFHRQSRALVAASEVHKARTDRHAFTDAERVRRAKDYFKLQEELHATEKLADVQQSEICQQLLKIHQLESRLAALDGTASKLWQWRRRSSSASLSDSL